MAKVELHHSIPLAIGGVDNVENIIKLGSSSHKITHAVLNIPYRYIRDYRKILNWSVLITEDILEAERKMQLAYFENSRELPREIFKAHYYNIVTQAKEEVKEIITYKQGNNAIISSINKMIDEREEIAYRINKIIQLWEFDLAEHIVRESQPYGKMPIRNDI